MISGPHFANLVFIALGCIALWVCFEAQKGLKKSDSEKDKKNK